KRGGDKRMGRGCAENAAPLARLHAGDRGGHRMERGGKIDGDDHVPIYAWKFLDWRDMLHPSVVHKYIDRTKLGFRLLDHGVDLVRFRHVGAGVNRRDAELLLDCGPLGFDRRGVAHAIDHDIGTLFSEGTGDGKTNAAGRAGYNGIARFQCHISSRSSRVWGPARIAAPPCYNGAAER